MIPINRPLVDDAEVQALASVVQSGWLSQGARVAEFETAFARNVGATHACAVSSCSAALHLALLAAGVGPGDEVITVSYSFIAGANVARLCGAVPVFVDIDPVTFNIDPLKLETAISNRTRAILCVDQVGMPCDLVSIVAIARPRGLVVIEDAACAVGSQIHFDGAWEPIGAPQADIACFSFHPRKIITTGEGGMLTTKRTDWDRGFRLLRQHGMTVDAAERHQSSKVMFESYESSGFNYRMTDLQAAIGLEQLRKLPEIVRRRRALAESYANMLAKIPDVSPPHEPTWARSNWQSYCVRLPPWAEQESIMQTMLDHGIATRRIRCAHLESAYSNYPVRYSLAYSEDAHRHCLLLPLFPQMTEEMQQKVIVALDTALKEQRKTRMAG